MFCLHTLSLDAWKWWMVYYCLNKFLASANGARFPFREFCETKLKNLENEPQHWIWAKQLGRSQLDDFTWSSVLVHLDDIRRAIFLLLFHSQPRWAFSKWYVPYVRNLINCFSIFSWICSRTWCLGDDQPENLQVGACHGSSQVNTSQGTLILFVQTEGRVFWRRVFCDYTYLWRSLKSLTLS